MHKSDFVCCVVLKRQHFFAFSSCLQFSHRLCRFVEYVTLAVVVETRCIHEIPFRFTKREEGEKIVVYNSGKVFKQWGACHEVLENYDCVKISRPRNFLPLVCTHDLFLAYIKCVCITSYERKHIFQLLVSSLSSHFKCIPVAFLVEKRYIIVITAL